MRKSSFSSTSQADAWQTTSRSVGFTNNDRCQNVAGSSSNPSELKKGSLEDAARRRRFQFFNRLAKKLSARAVVLAHTEDDLAEIDQIVGT